MIDKLDMLSRRYDELAELLGQPEVLSDLALLHEYSR